MIISRTSYWLPIEHFKIMIMQKTISIVGTFSNDNQVYISIEDRHNHLTLTALLYTQTSVKVTKITVLAFLRPNVCYINYNYNIGFY